MVDFPNEIRINPAVINKLILGGVVVVLVGIGVTSSFYKVDPREHAIVLRLGKFSGAPVTEQGLHFKLPFGIDQVTHVEVTEVRKLEFGFATQTPAPRTRYANRSQGQAETSLIVSGDLNIADVEWSTQYMVSDAYNYLFKVRGAEETFRAMNEAVMREVIGDRTINEVLTSGRSEIQQEVKEKLQDLATQYELGINLDKVILQDVNPHRRPSRRRGTMSMRHSRNTRQLSTQPSRSTTRLSPRRTVKPRERSRKPRATRCSGSMKRQGDADLFQQVFSAYKKAPEVTRTRIYLETLNEVLATGPRKIIMDTEAKGLLPMLNLNKEGKQ